MIFRAIHVISGVALLAALTVAGIGCQRSQAESAKPARAPEVRAILVTVARAETRAVQRTVETSGSLLAWDEVQARSEQPGRVERLRVDLGDRVETGAVLAEYDQREFRLAVEQAQADLLAVHESLARARATVASSEAQLRRARDTHATLEAEVARAQSQYEWSQSELERSKQLFAKNLIAARDVDSARNGFNVGAAQLTQAKIALAQHPDQVRVAEAQLQSDIAALKGAEAQVKQREATLGIAQKRLGDTTVRAPIAGFIAKRHISAGEYVNQNTPLFTVVAANPLKYVGTVPERNAPELHASQTVRLTVEAYQGKEFSGSVLRIAPAVDVATRTLMLEARVPNPNGALRPGFFAKGGVLTREDRSVVFVPADALTYIAGLNKVFVVANGKAQERLVKPGARQGSWIEISEGVKSGDQVATSNLPALFNGAPVVVGTSR